MTYRMAAVDAGQDLAGYVADNRRVTVQTLNLSLEQKQKLLTHLSWHEQPENATYRYDYFRQNCSTKVRDALDLALGGELSAVFSKRPSEQSYRSSLGEYSKGLLWMHIGVNLALGSPVEEPLSEYALFYLPDRLSAALQQVPAGAGLGGPLVTNTSVLHQGTVPASPGPAILSLTSLLLLSGLFLIARFAVIAKIWALVSGLLGSVLLVLWLATDHWAAAQNPTILALSPLLLAWPLLASSPRRGLSIIIALGLLAALMLSHGAVASAIVVFQLVALGLATTSITAKRSLPG